MAAEELLRLLKLLRKIRPKDVKKRVALEREKTAVTGRRHALAAQVVIEDGLVAKALALFERGDDGALAVGVRVVVVVLPWRVRPHFNLSPGMGGSGRSERVCEQWWWW